MPSVASGTDQANGVLLGIERRHQLLEALRETGSMNVAALRDRFAVTQETIRRDLKLLEREGHLRRVHGGAVLVQPGQVVPALRQRRSMMASEKDAIARAGAKYLPAGGAVLFDAGTTTGRLAELVPANSPLMILTNALPIATTLAAKPGVSVHTVGGRVRPPTLAEVDAAALRSLQEVSVDVAFMGSSGISERHGFSTADPAEAAVKRAMIRAAKQVIVLSDHSKLGVDFFARFAAFEEVNLLITDPGADPAVIANLEAHGLAVELATRQPDQGSAALQEAFDGSP